MLCMLPLFQTRESERESEKTAIMKRFRANFPISRASPLKRGEKPHSRRKNNKKSERKSPCTTQSQELNGFSKKKIRKKRGKRKITNFRTHRYKFLFLNQTVQFRYTICEHHRNHIEVGAENERKIACLKRSISRILRQPKSLVGRNFRADSGSNEPS